MAEKEYIEREAIEKAFAEEISTNYLDDYAKGFQAALLAVMSIPIADVAPVRHGHWIQRSRIIAYYECSECHCSIDQEPHYNYSDNIMVFPKYCEHCGAKMRAA